MTAGAEAANEMTVACAGAAPLQQLEQILQFSRSSEPIGQFQVSGTTIASKPGLKLPWIAGWELAKAARSHLSLGDGPLSDDTISDLLGIGKEHLKASTEGARPTVGLACTEQAGRMKFLFHKPTREARRFEAARFLADHLASMPEGNWIAVTDTATARQKQQRAFATEFLCPIDALVEHLPDYSSGAIEDAAEHFGISEKAVENHLINRGVLAAATI